MTIPEIIAARICTVEQLDTIQAEAAKRSRELTQFMAAIAAGLVVPVTDSIKEILEKDPESQNRFINATSREERAVIIHALINQEES